MLQEVLKQPSYQLFRRAYSEQIAPLTVFIGSGLSTGANLPDWRTLRQNIQLQLNNLYDVKLALSSKVQDDRFKRAKDTKDYWDFFQLAKELLVTSRDVV